ncbi:ABC transporter substrate-binding protein [Algoriphagus sediminis]|uniref:Thiamine pyrimidine synthase n=1 Tax=Algoriphagus sediminis TaxID=3057113 RepID=A0ABT7Y8P2_9BACT|nr:ABC transporter substrate-binding protein [Algoriphagus sediminis]MDN3202800.1 ABC transporter substrate-binding protein [Algoriphagus sediminis]
MDRINLALDWTPNINHIGFFIARDKAFFAELDLEVHISDPSFDNYAITPAKKVELGIADFALCPTESIISYQTKKKTFKLIGVSAILQEDLSAIVVSSDSGIQSPKDLDGKSYASYQARYEDEIVRQMIIKDGGMGALELHYPKKLGIWETVTKGQFDSTWIFLNWEGVEAEQKGVSLRSFRLADYDIPYSYSPILVTDEQNLRNREDAYRRFIQGCKKGFLHSVSNPEESIQILRKYLPPRDRDMDLAKCLEITAPHFGDKSNWGLISEQKMKSFLDWIYEHKLESKKLNVRNLYSNSLLKAKSNS